MTGRPDNTEAAPYYFTYIDQVDGNDPVEVMEHQLAAARSLFAEISETSSMRRYAPEKWTIRQVLNHITDTERAFAFRALWFARGFETPLPGYDQDIADAGADANRIAWYDHVEEFEFVRQSTIRLFKNLPPGAWTMSGVADGKPFTVRAIAYIIPGHVTHHLSILKERYLQPGKGN